MAENGARKNSVQSIRRAFAILEILMASDVPLSVIDISEKTGLNRTTVYGILNTLLDCQYVERDSSNRRYQASIKMYAMSCNYLDDLPIMRVCLAPLVDAASKLNAALHFTLLANENKLFLSRKFLPSGYSSFQTLRSGYGLPFHCTAGGKIHLAFQTEKRRRAILDSLEYTVYTRNTITSYQELCEELDTVAEYGFSTDENEYIYSNCCIGFPLFQSGGELAGAFSFSVFNDNYVQNCRKILSNGLELSAMCSRMLGCTSPPVFTPCEDFEPRHKLIVL